MGAQAWSVQSAHANAWLYVWFRENLHEIQASQAAFIPAEHGLRSLTPPYSDFSRWTI